MAEEILRTPCCGTEVEPGPGFRSVTCCGTQYSREDLRREQREEQEDDD